VITFTPTLIQKREVKVKVQTKLSEEIQNSRESKSEWSVVTPGERFSIRVSSEDSDGAYTMLEVFADQQNGTPMHIHENEDEQFIILEGTAHMAIGDKSVDAPAGTSITVSKGVPHAWCNLSRSPLRMLVLFMPGGIDELFRTIVQSGVLIEAPLFEKFDTKVVGPALFDNIYTIVSPRSKAALT
jgi:mannose-6-phosphate isomerase-like protein (cupin superfamily)